MRKPLSICSALDANLRGLHDQGEAILRRRLAKTPDDLRIQFNLGWHEMRHGNLKEGLRLMDAGRWINCFGGPPLKAGTPIYNQEIHGKDLIGKTILFHGENGGYGDQIANVRFATDFADRGATVVVSCETGLMSMFRRVKGVSVVVDSRHADHVAHDYWVPGFSAAHLLDHSYETLPNQPYISAKKVELPRKEGRLRIGVRWLGNPQFEHEQHREFPPELMFDVIRTFEDRADFWSLQRDQGSERVCESGAEDLQLFMQGWEGTAALIENMDLVISSCTSVAHLAAAMGKRTWVLIPVLPYYIWVWPNDDTTAWYPSVKLFKQKRYGHWKEPFAEVKRGLQRFLEARGYG